jgi:RsiW-degrading membrane proteinase PrsW (M82 family)
MSALLFVMLMLLMLLIAGLPIVAAVWYFRAKHAVAMRVFGAAMLAGLAAVLVAAGAQRFAASFTPQPNLQAGARWGILYTIFIEIAFTEEAARFLTMLLSVRLLKKSIKKNPRNRPALVKTFGMVSGFSFAAIETIFFAMTNTNINAGLIRVISTVPLHGACGIRAGRAILDGKHSAGLSVLSILFAVALHGVYNSLMQRGGGFTYLGVALAITALVSGAQSIHFEELDPSALD